MVSKLRSQLARENGCCPMHPTTKVLEGFATCERCVNRRKEMRARRKIAGKCVQHKDRDAIAGKTYCEECSQNRSKRGKETKQKRVELGICIKHGTRPAKDGYKYCDECLEKFSERKASIAVGFCKNHPDKPSLPDLAVCEECEQRNYLHRTKRSEKALKEKLCLRCYKNTQEIKTSCKDCWFKGKARKHLGDAHQWKKLETLFEQQKGICPYSGVKLIFGSSDITYTATIDHIVPKSKGGANVIENLQWISKRMNNIKNDLSHVEFIQFCRDITDRFSNKPESSPQS